MSLRVKSSIYLEKDLKEKAKKIFKNYGLTLSDGINLLLKEVIKNNNILSYFIEEVKEGEIDYKILENVEKNFKENQEEYVGFNEIKW